MGEVTLNKQHPHADLETHTGIPADSSNPTVQHIEAKIKENKGPIPHSEFMQISLYGKDGYYSKAKAEIGVNKDYITSPEASPVFGATVGASVMKVWETMDKPRDFRLIEMGGGSGALALSLLEWTKEFQPEFFEAIRYTLVDYGDLIQRQKEMLANFSNVDYIKGSAFQIPLHGVEGAFISNELPDAFPVEVVTRMNDQVKQKYITIEDGEWVEVWQEPSPDVQAYIDTYKIDVQSALEEPINLRAEQFQHQLDAALTRGAILTIDYGENGQVGKAGQATVRQYSPGGNPKDISQAYKSPGEVDITASVNFNVLEQVAKADGLTTVFSDIQRKFLVEHGALSIKVDYVMTGDIAGDYFCQMLQKDIDVKKD